MTVNGLKDQANTPNPLPANSRISFTAAEFVSASVGSSPVGTVVKTLAKGGFEITAAGSKSEEPRMNSGSPGNFGKGISTTGAGGNASDHRSVSPGRIDGAHRPDHQRPFAGIFTGSAQAGCFLSRKQLRGALSEPPPRRRLPLTMGRDLAAPETDGDTCPDTRDGMASPGHRRLCPGHSGFPGLRGTRSESSRKSDSAMLARFHDFGPTLSEVVDPVVITREPPGPTSRRTGLVFSNHVSPGPTPGVTNNLEFVEIFNAGSVFEGTLVAGPSMAPSSSRFPRASASGRRLVLISADPRPSKPLPRSRRTRPLDGISQKRRGNASNFEGQHGIRQTLSPLFSRGTLAGRRRRGGHSLVLTSEGRRIPGPGRPVTR